jgi:hypothetical protein
MNTMTGNGLEGGSLGVYTLSERQSSLVVPTLPRPEVAWRQLGPNAVASRGIDHPSAGFGGMKRCEPVGGAPYGMPRYSHVVPAAFPTRPPWVTVALHIVFDSFAGFASTPPPPPSGFGVVGEACSDELLQPSARVAATPSTHESAPLANETLLTLAISSLLRATATD